MPVLDIDDWDKQDEIQKAMSCQKVLAPMHFPKENKSDLRSEYLITAASGYFINLMKRDEKFYNLFGDIVRNYLDPLGGLEALLNSRSFDAIMKERISAVTDAVVAGKIFLSILGRWAKDPEDWSNKRMSVNKGAEAIEIESKRSHGKFVSKDTAKTCWKNMKQVVHLWAALITFVQTKDQLKKEGVAEPDEHFFHPASIMNLENLKQVLCVAECYKSWGLQYCPRDKEKPLLSDCDLYTLPDNFELPETHFMIAISGVEKLISDLKDYKAPT